MNLYLKYGIPSALVLCLEWWCFEIINVFAGWEGVEELDAAIGISSFINFVNMIPIGISESVAILVGNCIGADLPRKGIKFAKTNIIMTFSFGCFLMVVVFYFRTGIASVYSNSADVIYLIENTIPCYAIYLAIDFT